MVDVSLVMPAYNEGFCIETAIGRVDQAAEKLGLNYELIIVDDGSRDDTRLKAIKYANDNRHVQVVSYDLNMGKGYALKTGVDHAKGESVILMDSDLDIDASQISSYINALKYGDMVIASKRHPNSKFKTSPERKVLSLSFNVLVRLITGLKVSDTQSGLKAFRSGSIRKLMRFLTVKRFAFDVEVLTVAKLMKLKIVELPVKIDLRSSFSIRQVFRMMVDLAGIGYRLRIKRWYQTNMNNDEPKYKPIIKW
ncbi:MAG: glycosyltransferase [Candidatus Bathyarchaeota archaeon]